MPKVTIEHKSQLDPKDAFTKIKSFFESDHDIRRFDPKMQCSFNENNLSGKANGSQIKADISVKSEGSGSMIQVVVEIPLLMTPFKSKVQETISKKLSKYLA